MTKVKRFINSVVIGSFVLYTAVWYSATFFESICGILSKGLHQKYNLDVDFNIQSQSFRSETWMANDVFWAEIGLSLELGVCPCKIPRSTPPAAGEQHVTPK